MKRQLRIESLEQRRLLTSFTASLVHDLSPGMESTEFGRFFPSNEHLYFTANDGELWMTDGSDGDTPTFLADVEPTQWRGVVELQSGVGLFNVVSQTVGNRRYEELWRTDGSAAGTYRLFAEGTLNRTPVDVNQNWSLLPIINGDDLELWRIGATNDDVTLLTTIQGGRWQVTVEFLVHDDLVYASTNTRKSADDSFPRSLIRTDGTATGTQTITKSLSGFAVANDVGVHYVAHDEGGNHRLFRIADASAPPEPLAMVQGAVQGLRLFQNRFAYFYDATALGSETTNVQTARWLPGISDGTPEGTMTLEVEQAFPRSCRHGHS